MNNAHSINGNSMHYILAIFNHLLGLAELDVLAGSWGFINFSLGEKRMSLLNDFLRTKEGMELYKSHPKISQKDILSRRSFILDSDQKVFSESYESIEKKEKRFQESGRMVVPEMYDEDGLYDMPMKGYEEFDYDGEFSSFEGHSGANLLSKEEIIEALFWEDLGKSVFIPFRCISYEFMDAAAFEINDKTLYFIGCIMFEESPMKFKCIEVAFDKEKKKFLTRGITFNDNWMLFSELQMFDVFFDRLTSKQTVFGTSAFRLKTRFEGEKCVNETIYMTHKKYVDQLKKKASSSINWSHKWEVRGHWRKVDGIGKDREGKKCVKGFCWVKDHQKGEGKLIVKRRVSKLS